MWFRSVLLAVVSIHSSDAGGEPNRAETIYKQAIVLLAHTHNYQPADLERMRRAGVTGAVLKLTVDGVDWDLATRTRFSIPDTDTNWGARFGQRLQDLEALVSKEPVIIVKSADDIRRAKAEGKFAAIIGSEGSNHLEGGAAATDPEALQQSIRSLYGRGWRETQLRWSSNRLFSGDLLNGLGAIVLSELRKVGVLVDVSHLKGATFSQVLRLAPATPLVRSHDTPESFGGESSDQMILDLAQSGGGKGVFALHFYQGYYGRVVPSDGLANVKHLVAAITHVIHLLDAHGLKGINHVALGGDFFPEPGHWVARDDQLLLVVQELVDAGFSDEDIRKVLGENLLRLYGAVWK